MFDFLIFKLFMFFSFFQIFALDRPSIWDMKKKKNDNVYIEKTNGFRVYEQKRYLLRLIRDILKKLNGNNFIEESEFVLTFDTELSFPLFLLLLEDA